MAIYAYYRVSTKTQADKNGIGMQVSVVERYCADNGIEIAGAYADNGISGTKEDRDGLMDVIAALRPGDKVIVQNTSRLWRSDNVKVFVHRELMRAKCDVLSVEQPSYSIYEKDPNNFLFNSLMEMLDQYERMSIALKLAKGRRAKAQKGYKPCGNTPIGYKWENGKVCIDEEYAPVIQNIFTWYLTSKSYSVVCRKCKEYGYTSVKGNDFTAQSIKNILSNDFYVGIVTHAGKKTEGAHEPLIGKEMFETTNAKGGKTCKQEN